MEKIERLIELLGTEQGPRVAAALVAHGKDSIPALIRCLSSKDREVRSSAAWTLGELKAQEAAEEIELLLDDPDSSVRWFALGALHKISSLPNSGSPAHFVERPTQEAPSDDELPKVPEDLAGAIYSEDSFTRAYALRELFERQPHHPLIRKTVDNLASKLSEDEAHTRSWAAFTLSTLGESAIPALSKAAIDPDPTTRMYAAWALGLSLCPQAVEPLLDAIEDSEMAVRAACTIALADLADGKAVGRLINALKDSHWLVREGAARALGAIGNRNVIPYLSELSTDPDERVRRSAAEAVTTLEKAKHGKRVA